MSNWVIKFFLIFACSSFIACTQSDLTSTKNSDTDIARSAKLIGARVVNWQLTHLDNVNYVRTFKEDTANEKDWIQAALWIGATRWAEKSGDPAVAAAVTAVGERNQYQLDDRPFHADDHAIGQAYLWVYEHTKNPMAYRHIQETFDFVLAAKPKNDMLFVASEDPRYEGTCQDRWCWADALFMAPRTWIMLGNATGEDKYIDYADKEYWAATDYLFDHNLGLYYRDSRYFNSRSENGKPVFWSRGNGWVYAGLPLIIEALPTNHPSKKKYISLFKEMSTSLILLQRENGFWPASLMDPNAVTTPETSGTAFITFGLAWGVNNKILNDNKAIEVVNKGWHAIESAVTPAGKVEWVQQVGKAPDPVLQSDTQLYGVGAVLLAAAELRDWQY